MNTTTRTPEQAFYEKFKEWAHSNPREDADDMVAWLDWCGLVVVPKASR